MRDALIKLLTRVSLDHPGATLAVIGAITVFMGAMIPGITVNTGHSSMASPDAPYQRQYAEFLERFGSPNQLVVMVEGGSEPLRRRVVARLVDDLPQRQSAADGSAGGCRADAPPRQPGCVRTALGHLDLDRLGSYALLYLPPDELTSAVDALASDEIGLGALRSLTGLSSLLAMLTAEIERRGDDPAPTGKELERARETMEILGKFLGELAVRVRDPERASVTLEEAVFQQSAERGVDAEGYLSSNDGSIKLMVVRPDDDSDDPKVVLPFVSYVGAHVDAIREELSATCVARPGACPDGPLRTTLTGLPAVVADEAQVIAADVGFTGWLSSLGIVLLFLIGFRSVRQAIVGMAPLALSLVWALGFVRLAFGGLNLVTASFIPIVLGLGIDFSIHLMSRFNEARRDGCDVRAAAEVAMDKAGPGILTGAVTTAGAFFALAVNDFRAFWELGSIIGFSLLAALVITFTALPALLVLPALRFLRVEPRPAREPSRRTWRLPDIPALVDRRAPVVVVVGVLAAGVMLYFARDVGWSYDYVEMMPEGMASTEGLIKLSKRTDFSAEVAAVDASSLEQAEAFASQLRGKATVTRVESIAAYVPADQEQKRAILRRLLPLVDAATPIARPVPVAADQLADALQALADALEDAQFEAKRGGSDYATLLDPPLVGVRQLRVAMADVPPADAAARLEAVQALLLRTRDRALRIISDSVHAGEVTAATVLERLPEAMSERLANEGHFAVYAYPSQPIWDKVFLDRFVADLRSVWPGATGFPVIHLEMLGAVEAGARTAALLALATLFLLLLLDFRSFRYALLSIVPLGMAVAWTWGGISLLGFHYNAGNVIALPLILGIAVCSGVHILHRYRQEGERGVPNVVRHTGLAILLSGLTTMVGFGSLSLAHHRAAQTLGIFLLLGVGAGLAAAILFLPALLELVSRRRGR